MGLFSSSKMSNKRWLHSLLFSFVFAVVFFRIYHPIFSTFDQLHITSEEESLPPCSQLPGMEDVFVIVKTGATEIRPRLPQTLDVTLRCVPDFAVFSDFEEEAFGVHIHDVLESYDPKIKSTHPDFALYRSMQKLQSVSKLMPSDLILAEGGNHNGHGNNAAWVLDKWKFAPIIDKALELRPNKKWFFIIEVDTYVIWPNLMTWISKLNNTEPVYIGSAMSIGDDTFAYGGSGTLMSNSAMRKASEERHRDLKRWDQRTSEHWAGDALLGLIMKEAGVKLKWSHPLMVIDGVEKSQVGGAGWGRNIGCSPAVTFHHMQPEEIRRMTGFDREWFRENPNIPILHHHLFQYYILPTILDSPISEPPTPSGTTHLIRTDWDNENDIDLGTDGKPRDLAYCGIFCEKTPDCVQYTVFDGKCKYSKGVRLGGVSEKFGKDGKAVQSGWVRERVVEMFEVLEGCGGKSGKEKWVV